jgi:hypothetical protein
LVWGLMPKNPSLMASKKAPHATAVQVRLEPHERDLNLWRGALPKRVVLDVFSDHSLGKGSTNLVRSMRLCESLARMGPSTPLDHFHRLMLSHRRRTSRNVR